MATGFHSAFLSPAPARQKPSWRSSPWTRSACPVRRDAPSHDRRSKWRIAGRGSRVGDRGSGIAGRGSRVGDRGSARRAFRAVRRRRGSGMGIPPKRRPANWKPKRGRPVVARNEADRCRSPGERSFAWLGQFRRLLIRWEPRFGVYRSCFAIGVLFLCVRRRCGACGRPCRLLRALPAPAEA
jgi:hypothetical protein